MWATLKWWLNEWGNLLLTAVIAAGAAGQFLVARRLARLEQRVDEDRSRIAVFAQVEDRLGPHLRISNLSAFGLWVDRIDATDCNSGQTVSTLVHKIIPSSETESFHFDFSRTEAGPSTVEVVAHCVGNNRNVSTKTIRRKISVSQDSMGGIVTTIDSE